MKRYFYSDPLAVAWMAKHFGMRFWNGKHEIHVLPIVNADGSYCTLVHPDSLHLLEARKGDLLTGSNRKVFMFNVGARPLPNAWVAERNGKVFHWPESKEV